jgi:colanic acid biosynthesis glycosyl transferase WcaI
VIRPLAAEGVLRAELGLPAAASIALYSGNLGQKQGLEVIVEAARLLARAPGAADVLFLICGAGSALDELRAAAADLPNVRFVPLQPAERLNELLNLATVHLLPQKANAEDLVMPSKLAGMLASGRPVIATARLESEVGRLLEGAGVVVPPGDAGALAAAVAALVADPARGARLGAAGRAVALETCDRDAILARAFATESVAARAGSA